MKKLFACVLTFLMLLSVFTAAFSCGASAAGDGTWIGTWSASPVDYYISLDNYISGVQINGVLPAGTTTRTQLTVSAPGSKLRLKLSNEYGNTAVTINEVTVARTNTTKKCAIDTGTIVRLTFAGDRKIVIPAGGSVWSDEVDMNVTALEKLSVSMYFANQTRIKTTGLFGGSTYETHGMVSQTEAERFYVDSEITLATGVNAYHVIPFLTNIDVYSPDPDAYSTVLVGDSTLTNGCGAYLAEKLVNAGHTNIGVLNAAIMGNRLLYNGVGLIGNLYGDALIDRFSRDALEQTGVKKIIVKIGVNDVLHPTSKSLGKAAPYASTDEIIAGYEQLIDRAHEKGIDIYFMEITPWHGYVRDILGNNSDIVWTSELQQMCDTLNEWISTNDKADGYVDCSALGKDTDYTTICSQFTKDGIHLTDLGAMVLADAIPASFFSIESDDVISVCDLNDADVNGSGKSAMNSFMLKLQNAMTFVRQLLNSLRIELEPVLDFFEKL